MFVESIRPSKVLEFLKTCYGYEKATKVTFQVGEENKPLGILIFTVEFSEEPPKSVSKVVTATDTHIFFSKNLKWIKFLYSIFGETYKKWYKEEQEKEFNSIFGTDEKELSEEQEE